MSGPSQEQAMMGAGGTGWELEAHDVSWRHGMGADLEVRLITIIGPTLSLVGSGCTMDALALI